MQKKWPLFISNYKEPFLLKIIALVKLSITNVNHYIAKLLFKASGVDVYGRTAPQKGPCAVFVSSFYLQTQEGKEAETERVYSFSNKETNYKGLSNCLGNSRRIFVETFCSKLLFFFFLPFSKSAHWLWVSCFKGQNCRILFAVKKRKKEELDEGTSAEGTSVFLRSHKATLQLWRKHLLLEVHSCLNNWRPNYS